jgi:hypothetical protein
MKRHKWNGRVIGESSGFRGGLSVACMKCGCVKEIIGGKITYFLNDSVNTKAPECRISDHQSNQP